MAAAAGKGLLSGRVGGSYQPPDASTAVERQSWAQYAGSFSAEWAFACAVSAVLGGVLLGCGVLLAWPLRALSASVLSGVGALGDASATASLGNGTAAPPPLLLLQPAWDFAAKDYGHITSSPAFPGALSIAYFFASCLPYMALDMLPAWLPVIGSLKQYKVQPDKPVEWKDIRKSFRACM